MCDLAQIRLGDFSTVLILSCSIFIFSVTAAEKKCSILLFKHSCTVDSLSNILIYLGEITQRTCEELAIFLLYLCSLHSARYMNALDAGVTQFSEKLKFKDIVRTQDQFRRLVKNPKRKSNGKEGLRVHSSLQVSYFFMEIRLLAAF